MSIISYLCAALLAVAFPNPCSSLGYSCEAITTTALLDGPMDPCVDGDLVAARTSFEPNEGACDE